MAGKYDIAIEQGATWTLNLTYRDGDNNLVNLTGYTARMHIRPFARSKTLILERSSAESTMILGGALGTLQVKATADETAALPPGSAVYDIELYSPGGSTIRLLEGEVQVSAEVTR